MQICLHQVGTGQVLVGGADAGIALAGDAHKPGQTGAGADEHGLKTHVLHQLVDGEHLADNHIGHDLHAQRFQLVHLALHDGLGETELRDAVDQNAAGGVECLKDGDLIALL